MKKSLMAASVVIFIPAGTAIAKPVTKEHRHQYEQAYGAVANKLGKRAPGCHLFRTCHIKVQDEDVMKSLGVLERMLTPSVVVAYSSPPSRSVSNYSSSAPTVTHTYTSSYSSGGGYSDVPGVPSGFAACVAMRESTNGAGSSNIYGIQGGGGSGSLASQKAAFAQMYAARGTQPWSNYDGC